MAETILFWLFAVGSVATALAVVFPPIPKARDPIHSAIALVACMFCVAALYAMLAAHLVAVLQVLVYAGAIMVLFIFVIMLLNLQADAETRARLGPMKVVGGVLAAGLAVALVTAIAKPEFTKPLGAAATAAQVDKAYGTLEPIGHLLFEKYLLPFELASVLLLAAIVGAVIIAKRDPRTTFTPEEERQRLYRERHGKKPMPGSRRRVPVTANDGGHHGGHGHGHEESA
jgi:NADH-quinone oxidoreductase subunit J